MPDTPPGTSRRIILILFAAALILSWMVAGNFFGYHRLPDCYLWSLLSCNIALLYVIWQLYPAAAARSASESNHLFLFLILIIFLPSSRGRRRGRFTPPPGFPSPPKSASLPRVSTLRIQELPEGDRPREKLTAHGAAALTDSELIAILLRTGLPGANAVDVARQLLAEFRTLGGLARCTVTELSRIKGVGPAKAVQLAAAFGLASRLARETLHRQPINSPAHIYELLGAELRALHRESLRIVLLDTKLNLLRVEEISSGSLNETVAHPREILRPALLYSAYAFVLVHNHPSGDPTPSDADRRLTLRLAEAASLLQIQFHDHVIIGTASTGRHPWFSFREMGLLG